MRQLHRLRTGPKGVRDYYGEAASCLHDRPSSSSRTLGIGPSYGYSKRYNHTIHHHRKPTLPTLPTLPCKGEVQGEVNGKFNG